MASSLGVFLLPLFLLVATAAASTVAPNATRIHEVCNRTLHSDFCVKSLLDDPNTLTADDKTLAGIAIRIAADRSTEAAVFATALLQDQGGSDEGLDQCLNDCTENFVDATSQLDSATSALDEDAYEGVDALVRAAMAAAASCNEGCKAGVPEGRSLGVVEQKSEDFFKMCDIALVLTKLLNK